MELRIARHFLYHQSLMASETASCAFQGWGLRGCEGYEEIPCDRYLFFRRYVTSWKLFAPKSPSL
jgi:hypothetical protein